MQERDRAVTEAQALRRELAQVRTEFDTAGVSWSTRAAAEDADRARVRAEAASDTLREVLEALRGPGPATPG